MNAKSLFNIILKVIGIIFLRDFIGVAPQFISMISLMINGFDSMLSPFVASVLTVGAYGYFAYVLLFRTEWLIEKLKLTSGISADVFTFKVHRSTVLTIVVLIVGALMVANTLPVFLRQLLFYFQYMRTQDGYGNPSSKPDYTLLLLYGLQIIIGLLIMGHLQRIVNYIELRRKNTVSHEVFDVQEEKHQ